MRSLVREVRLELGLSMQQLGALMGVSPTSVSSLERNEAAGTAKTGTVQRALEAMGKSAVTFVAPSESLIRAQSTAQRIAKSVETTMALEGQQIPPAVVREVFERALHNEMAKL